MKSPDSAHESNLSQTVLKALDLIECLATAKYPLSAPEVAKQCQISRPTAYRLLSTLQSRGYVTNVEHEYALGTKFLSLSRVLLESFALSDLVHPYLRELNDISGETTYVSVLDNTKILYISKVESTQAIRTNCTIGTRNPVYSSSMGKAILAFLPEAEQKALINQIDLVKYASNTITDRDELLEELRLTRQRGYALDDNEMEDNVRCVGAPIFDHMRHPIAAMSISGPAYRMTRERLEELSPHLIECTQIISQKLGYIPDNSVSDTDRVPLRD